MLHKFFSALGLGALLVGLAGCCANNPCDCNDLLADSLFFRFDRTQFTNHELATVYLTRHLATNYRVSIDSLPLPRAQRSSAAILNRLVATGIDTTSLKSGFGLLTINNTSPFSTLTSGANLSRYSYFLYVPRDSVPGVFYKKPRYYQYLFDGIQLQGRYRADGCCTCYQNTQKLLRVSGGPYTLTSLNVTEDTGQPRLILLSK